MKKLVITSVWQKPNSKDREVFRFYIDEVKEKIAELEGKGYKYLASIGRSE